MTMDHVTLIVGYRKARYALDASAVQEVVWLPELSPIEEMPPYIRGIFSLRGDVVPVLDIGVRFGYAPVELSSQDRVVVITVDGRRVGLLVHHLHDVVPINDDDIEPVRNFQIPGGQTRYLRGAVEQDAALLMLLDPRALLDDTIDTEQISEPPEWDDGRETLDEAEDLLWTRARHLARPADRTADVDLTSYALIRLGGELFGVEITNVSEFVHRRRITPVPCAPSHIVGNVNLRGDILTVIDIRAIVGVPATIPAEEIAVMIVDGRQFGILVESIDDVLGIPKDVIRPAPVSGRSNSVVSPLVASLESGVASLIDAVSLFSALRSRQRPPFPNQSGDVK